jgi:zinc and cadmium transporter
MVNYGILSSVIISLTVIGFASKIKFSDDNPGIKNVIAIAIGVILSILFLHLMPEVMQDESRIPRLVALGSFLALVFLGWFSHEHDHGEENRPHKHKNNNLIYLGQAIHSLSDGIAVYITFNLGVVSGILVSLAILAHHIPMVIGLIHRYKMKGQVKLKLMLLTTMIPLGSLLAMLIGDLGKFSKLPIAFSAASFMYTGGHDLIDYLNGHKDDSKWVRICYVMIGVTIGVISELIA